MSIETDISEKFKNIGIITTENGDTVEPEPHTIFGLKCKVDKLEAVVGDIIAYLDLHDTSIKSVDTTVKAMDVSVKALTDSVKSLDEAIKIP